VFTHHGLHVGANAEIRARLRRAKQDESCFSIRREIADCNARIELGALVSMVSGGMGVSVVPAMAVEKHPGCRFVRLDDERTARRVGLAQLKYRSASRVQRVLLDEIRASVQSGKTRTAS
jgi:DNA-binding transcriptional LysR family regulator